MPNWDGWSRKRQVFTVEDKLRDHQGKRHAKGDGEERVIPRVQQAADENFILAKRINVVVQPTEIYWLVQAVIGQAEHQ
jgi:hypothetical protein